MSTQQPRSTQPSAQEVAERLQSLFRMNLFNVALVEKAILRAQKEFLNGIIELLDTRIQEIDTPSRKAEHIKLH